MISPKHFPNQILKFSFCFGEVLNFFLFKGRKISEIYDISLIFKGLNVKNPNPLGLEQ